MVRKTRKKKESRKKLPHYFDVTYKQLDGTIRTSLIRIIEYPDLIGKIDDQVERSADKLCNFLAAELINIAPRRSMETANSGQ